MKLQYIEFLKSKYSFASFSEPLTDVNLFIYYYVLCITYVHAYVGFPGRSNSKEFACNAGYLGLIPGLRKSLGEENGYPLQYSCLGNPMDRGAWQATVHGVAELNTTE